MKKFKTNLLLALMILLAVSPVLANGQKEAADDSVVVGVSFPTQREGGWVAGKKAMEAYAEEIGLDLRMVVADADMAQQSAQVESLIVQQVDVLILAPHDASAAAPLVEKAHKEGIPVISYDRLVMNSPELDLYITYDNEKIGELQGEFITNKVPEGNYIIMAGAPTDNNALLFKAGAMKYIQPLIDSGKINVIADQFVENWLPANALNIVENALTASENNVDAILAPNDGTAGGAIVALEAQGMAGSVPITGLDAEAAAARRIVEGTQSMTVFKDNNILAREAIDIAIKLAKGEEIAVNSTIDNNAKQVDCYFLPPIVVTKDNLDEALIGSGYLSKEDVYGN